MPCRRRRRTAICAACSAMFKPWRNSSEYCTTLCANRAQANSHAKVKCSRCGLVSRPSQMARSRAGNKSRYLGMCPSCQTIANQESRGLFPWWRKRIPMMLCNARIRANSKRIPFELTKNDIVVPDICPVFGVPFSRKSDGYFSGSMSPSIDRIDNARGYTCDNIIVVSCRANSIKGDATVDEMLTVSAFYANLQSKSKTGRTK
jgi:hypothetical protein